MAGSSPDMTMEQMIAMKEGLEAQIRAMSKPEGQPNTSLAGKFTQKAGYQRDVEEPRKLETGQMYEVVANFVAVRTLPSLQAPFLRRLKKGARVEMFEWDKTRCWRRVCIETPVDAEEKPRPPRMTEAQKRWATAEPVWDSVSGRWVDAAPKVEVLDSDSDDVVVKKDAWIMVHHPEMGLLLQAVTEMGEPEKDLSSVPAQETKVEDVKQLQDLSNLQQHSGAAFAFAAEKARFDFFWGNSPNAAPPMQTPSRAQIPPSQIPPPARQQESEPSRAAAELPLMEAVRKSDEIEVRALLKTGTDPNAADVLGETALFEAASAANVRIVAALLLHGADPWHRSAHGSLAVDMAEDPATQALLRKWQEEDVSNCDLATALRNLTETDAEAVAERLKVGQLTEDPPDVVVKEESAPAPQEQKAVATPGVRYRVVYKKVAVRKEPDTKSQALRQLPQG
ncbi:TEX14, partial [Symbiodinium pilosum]